MNGSDGISVSRIDIAWALLVTVLLVVTSYYSGVCATRATHMKQRLRSVLELDEEKQACGKAYVKYRGCRWYVSKFDDDHYEVFDLD